ncbi:MAG: hypothetical protein Q8O04_01670 [Deltaproteobacteria bacterium]|nr:hypothetical protein [Deltaproteobacteria bacterium]
MKIVINFILAVLLSCCFLLSCASSIVDGERIRTLNSILKPKPEDAVIEIYFLGKSPDRPAIEVGRVSARAWVLEKGINELKVHARELGADAVTNIRYERRFSMDYLQDLYFLDGDAVVWK